MKQKLYDQIMEEIITHADNGVPPVGLIPLVAELVGTSQKNVKIVFADYWAGV